MKGILVLLTALFLGTFWITQNSWSKWRTSYGAIKKELAVTNCSYKHYSSSTIIWKVEGKEIGSNVKRSVDITEFYQYVKRYNLSKDLIFGESLCDAGINIPVWEFSNGDFHQRAYGVERETPMLRKTYYDDMVLYGFISVLLLLSSIAMLYKIRKTLLIILLFAAPLASQPASTFTLTEYAPTNFEAKVIFYPEDYPTLRLTTLDISSFKLSSPEMALLCHLNANSPEFSAFCSQSTKHFKPKKPSHYSHVSKANKEDIDFKLLTKASVIENGDSLTIIKYQINDYVAQKGYNAVKRFIKEDNEWKVMTEPLVIDMEYVMLILSRDFLRTIFFDFNRIKEESLLPNSYLRKDGVADFSLLSDFIVAEIKKGNDSITSMINPIVFKIN